MQPGETRGKTEGPRCEMDADCEPIGFFFPLIPNGINHPFLQISYQENWDISPGRRDAIPNAVGMELSSLHCGNRQTLLGKNRMYNLFLFVCSSVCSHVAAERMYFHHVQRNYFNVLFRISMYVLCKQLYSL